MLEAEISLRFLVYRDCVVTLDLEVELHHIIALVEESAGSSEPLYCELLLGGEIFLLRSS